MAKTTPGVNKGVNKGAIKKKAKKDYPWTLIKADYLAGVEPQAIANKYNMEDIRTLYWTIDNRGWKEEKTKINEKTLFEVEEKVKKGYAESVDYMREVVNNKEEDTKNRLVAAKALMDAVTKTSKIEITGKDGAPLTVQKEYILPDEVKEFEKHYKDALGE